MKPYDLETKVPHFGRIKAVRRGEMEWEYLLVKASTVTWLSHADIEAILEVNKVKTHREDRRVHV